MVSQYTSLYIRRISTPILPPSIGRKGKGLDHGDCTEALTATTYSNKSTATTYSEQNRVSVNRVVPQTLPGTVL